MKRITAAILILLISLSSLIPCIATAKDGYSDLPVIFVPGFSSSQLLIKNNDGTTEKVWGIDVDNVRAKVNEKRGKSDTEVSDFIIFAFGMLLLQFNNPEIVRQEAKRPIDVVAGTLATDNNGDSVNNIRPVIEPTAEAARYSALSEDNKAFSTFPEGYLDYDNVFVLGMDFRLDVLYNVDLLERLIDSVLEETGAEKVNILCQSYGGQVTGTYLSIHANDEVQKVNNVVMTCPALGGAALAYDFLTGDMKFDEEAIAEFAEYMLDVEPDYHLLFDSDPLKIVDDFIKTVYDDVYIHVGTWPSFWDFVPYDDYKQLISEKLDPVANAELIEKTTYFHETYMKNFGENLRAAQSNGVNISIIAGTGTSSLTGIQVNSDGIIPVACSTGATPAPWGKRYNDGYNTRNTVCNETDHNHLSPSMDIDASTCYLPENTWFIQNYFHGQEMQEEYNRSLCVRQLLSDELLHDVYSSPDFPQFHMSASKSQKVHAAFNNSPEGYLSADDDSVVITNTSSSAMYITDVRTEVPSIVFDYIDTVIDPGESKVIPFTGKLPEVSLTTIKLSVSYVLLGFINPTPAGSREFTFTIMNGEAPEYDESSPYISTDSPSPTHNTVKGVAESLRFIKRTIIRIVKLLEKIVQLFKT